MPQLIPLTVNGTTVQAVELTFEPHLEPWAEYQLADGGRVRVRATVQKLFRVLDADGKPAFDKNGDPWIVVRHIVQVSSSA